jgi:hypothetical protein
MNKAELSLGFSFNEKDIKISTSPFSAFPTFPPLKKLILFQEKKAKLVSKWKK